MNPRNALLCLCLLFAAFAALAGPLHRAAADGDIDALKSAIQAGEELDGTDRPAIVIAAEEQQNAVVDLLENWGKGDGEEEDDDEDCD